MSDYDRSKYTRLLFEKCTSCETHYQDSCRRYDNCFPGKLKICLPILPVKIKNYRHRATAIIVDDEGYECCGFIWCKNDNCRKKIEIIEGHLFRYYSDSGKIRKAHSCAIGKCGKYES